MPGRASGSSFSYSREKKNATSPAPERRRTEGLSTRIWPGATARSSGLASQPPVASRISARVNCTPASSALRLLVVALDDLLSEVVLVLREENRVLVLLENH